MNCPVCDANWADSNGSTCPACRFDAASPQAKDAGQIELHKKKYQESVMAYEPGKRVGWRDISLPYVGLILGIVLFLLYLRACSTMGWRIF